MKERLNVSLLRVLANREQGGLLSRCSSHKYPIKGGIEVRYDLPRINLSLGDTVSWRLEAETSNGCNESTVRVIFTLKKPEMYNDLKGRYVGIYLGSTDDMICVGQIQTNKREEDLRSECDDGGVSLRVDWGNDPTHESLSVSLPATQIPKLSVVCSPKR